MTTRFRVQLLRRVAGLVMAAGVVMSAATAAGFFGRTWWRLDLLSHFRVQYCVGLALAALLCALLRRRRSALVFGLCAAVNIMLVFPLFTGRRSAPPAAARFRAVAMNVHTSNTRYEAVRAFILESGADVVVVQEINARWLSELRQLQATYPYVEAHAREDNFGIVLLSRMPLREPGIAWLGKARVPSVHALCRIGDVEVFILGTHPLPPANAQCAAMRNDQFEGIATFLETIENRVVLLGDLNATPWSPYFRDLLRATSLADSTRGWGIQPSWPTFLPPLMIPIDHCLVSPGITVEGRRIGPHIGSDHRPLVVDLAL